MVEVSIDQPAVESVAPAAVSAVGAPEWLNARRQSAWQKFQDTETPGRTDQLWRFSSLRQLKLKGVSYAGEVAAADAQALSAQSAMLEDVAARFVFVNEACVTHDVLDASLEAAGVKVLPLDQALVELGDVVEKHFMAREAKLGSAKYMALHEAAASSGVVVFVPKGVEVSKPIEITHWVSGADVMVFPHTLIVAEDNASVKVIDQFRSADDASANWVVGANDLVAGDGARIGYYAVQELNAASRAILVNNSVAGKNATTTSFVLNTGGKWVRTENMSYVQGEGANSYMLSVSLPDSGQEYDQRTFQHHKSPHTVSDLLFKNALFGKSRTVFSGLIMVDEGAHYTDAYQTCRNLLNSDEAEANSMPGLEINADQVKCSHGSTSAQIDRDELFYFLARGIDEHVARFMVIAGYTQEVIEKIGDEAIEALLADRIEAKLRTIGV
ncbi:Fe-S cluster assembly protein SufD [Sulfuriroseicoccus oceanibius]|uniref:Fe-S cluster assembly protein SufD n=1 Tax=Sulfuriroseicoccus oceanibius TaxID=2707525 RepID=A0A6B3L1V5_9BACT|nr:Fe-S cluster assembly protein SufD [Sulfuriroseicoccus oceanibius]QQL44282.1 Fe-S cluster assembly protein SufD [Sulfuriroseicoccus oceanibius]